ncbi:T9SS type A sorting domain-containing protein [Winogradskyella sp.]|uniref:T9SS type A sorting domain-containing protein n=1 Tax=Winogradskyella sp. TaxID=1883156 RepID=UPI00262C200B|nr:T9SS type A sorting domain-containing protein [Winogradskyella sp.]
MKKITLLLFALVLFNLNNAQNIIWSDDFNDEDVSDWTLTDSDGDGNNWGDIFQIQDTATPPNPVTPVSFISRSWQGAPLFPDNWAVSPAIDLTNAGGTITVNWITQVAAQSWDEEKYSVHVGTSNDIAVLINSATSMTQTLGDVGNTGTPTPQSLDISSLAGEPVVYIAFRHWDCTDQDFLSVDDLEVNATTLSVDEFTANSFSYNYNNITEDLVINSSNENFTRIEIFSILGQNVITKQLTSSNESINVSEIRDGIYLAKIYINGNSKTVKFIKS